MKPLNSSTAPFIHHEDSTRSMMADVIIALTPAAVWGVYAFGLRALVILLISVFSSVLFEFLLGLCLKKPLICTDLSAVVTGLILALTMPVSVPLYLVPLGAFVAILVAKGAFGGLGRNIVNPALLGRGVLCLIFGSSMTFFLNPFTSPSALSLTLSRAAWVEHTMTQSLTERMREGVMPDQIRYTDLVTGSVAGGIGEVSALVLLAGFLYLLVRKVITWHTPVFFVGTVAALAFLFPYGVVARGDFMLASLLTGGLLFGAIFLANDPVTSPVTTGGKIVYGILCGALLYLFRYFFGDAFATTFAILLANLPARFLDLLFFPRAYGTRRRGFAPLAERVRGFVIPLWKKVEEKIKTKA
jgi:electron transport complex protein RnfD